LLPLADHNPRQTTPVVNIVLVAVNVLVFLWEISLGPQIEPVLSNVAFVPARFWYMPGALLPNIVTMFVSMFLHGGWLHLGGNMLYLWIFGDNVEDELGHFRYLVFYLAAGAGATLLQAVLMPGSDVPNLGASGAIAGVLGAYFVLHPRARVVTLVPLFFLFPLVEVPAGLYLLFWFLLQFWMGSSSLATAPGAAGGVAWWAHVGGFIAGVLLVFLMRPSRRPAPSYRIS